MLGISKEVSGYSKRPAVHIRDFIISSWRRDACSAIGKHFSAQNQDNFPSIQGGLPAVSNVTLMVLLPKMKQGYYGHHH